MCFSVCIKNFNTQEKYVKLYDDIASFEEAVLLSQLAMCDKKDDELIFILPGWNIGINKNHKEDYKKSLLLAKKYKVS